MTKAQKVRALRRRVLRRRIEAALASYPRRGASPADRRVWSAEFTALTTELEREVRAEATARMNRDDATVGTNTGLQWTATDAVTHTATGADTVSAYIRPTKPSSGVKGYLWSIQTPEESIGCSTADSVHEAKAAVASQHKTWLSIKAARTRLDRQLATRDPGR